MAQAPTSDQTKELLEDSQRQDDEKLASQQEQGKDFVNNGQGVIPEDVWQNLPGKTEQNNG